MFGTRITLAKNAKDEAEKPFWISYADLMTALMVLFLVAMSVALLAVTKKVDESERRKNQRDSEIRQLLEQVKQAADEFPGMYVDMQRRSIYFGPQAHFEHDKYLVSGETAAQLRAFVRKLLNIARQPLGQKWLKLIVVEGYTSTAGPYLYNLDLSLKRSHKVLCVLLEQPVNSQSFLTEDEQKEVRKYFLVGGYSFNSSKKSPDESRRIELRLEFLGLDETREPVIDQNGKLGECQLR